MESRVSAPSNIEKDGDCFSRVYDGGYFLFSPICLSCLDESKVSDAANSKADSSSYSKNIEVPDNMTRYFLAVSDQCYYFIDMLTVEVFLSS